MATQVEPPAVDSPQPKPAWLPRAARSMARCLFSPGIGLLVSVSLVFVLQFQVLRFCLLWGNRELASDVSAAEIATSFVVGLRFDLAMAAYLAMALLLLATGARMLLGSTAQRRVYVVAGSLAGLLFWIVGLAEVEFYREFFSRYNSLALHYWKQGRRCCG